MGKEYGCGAFLYADRVCLYLPQRLRSLRLEGGLSIREFVDKCCISREMLRQVELGKSNPTIHLCSRLAYGTGCSLGTFLTRIEAAADAAEESGE